MPSFFSSSQWPVLVGLTFLIVGCSKNLPDPDSAGAAPAMAHTGAPLTEDDCKKFGENLENAVLAEDTAEFNRLFRFKEMLERSVSDLGLSASEEKGFVAGASKAGSAFPAQFIKVVQEGGSYTMLRVRTVDGRPRVLLRLLHGDGAVNYHELTLVRYPDQQIAAEDIYIYASGEPISQTFRRLILGFMAEKNQGISKLTAKEQLLSKHLGDISKITALVRNGQNTEALDLFRKLPAELQKNKFFQIMAIQAAGGTGNDDDYLREMRRFHKNHPNDAAGDLLSIDYYLLKKDYDETLKAIARLDMSVGGDPYLDAQKAGVLCEAGRFEEALAYAEKAIKDAPKLPQGYWVRTAVAAREKDHDDTLKCLKVIVEKVEPTLDPDALAADDRFVDFVTTPQFDEFKKWLAKRAE